MTGMIAAKYYQITLFSIIFLGSDVTSLELLSLEIVSATTALLVLIVALFFALFSLS